MTERARVRWVNRKTISGAWEVLWVDLNGKSDSATFRVEEDQAERYDARGRQMKPRSIDVIKKAREKEAIQLQTQINARLAEGRSTTTLSGRSKTFREVADRMQSVEAHALENKTNDGYEEMYRLHIFPTFGKQPIHSISSMDIEEWWAEAQTSVQPNGKPYAPSTLNGWLTALGKVFKYAVRHGLIGRNPVLGTRRIKPPHPEIEFYTPREVATLLDELSLTPPYDLVVRFACKTGLRPGELEALRIGDVKHFNFQRGHVQVRRQRQHTTNHGWEEKRLKTSAASRDVPLSGGLLSELRDLGTHPHRDNPTAFLWPGRDKGGASSHRLTSDGADRRLNFDKPIRVAGVHRSHVLPAQQERGLREMEWYAFRHFYASMCAAEGYDIHTVAKLMGHANISLTYSTYMHLFPNHQNMSSLDSLDAVAPVPKLRRIGAAS
jgi:integrase